MATIVFDFDGTLANSLPTVIEIYKELLPGKHNITSRDIQKLRGMSVQKVTAELGISFWKVPFLLRRGRRMMHARIHEIDMFNGIPEVVHELKQRGYTLYVLSSNSTENVELFLQEKGIRDSAH
jgi:phosphoglycolate phosphatase